MSLIPVTRLVGRDAARVLAEADFVVLPVGSVEWHGPHLPLGADTILAEGFAGELDTDDWTAVLYPTVALTAAPGQTRSYPGTIGIRPEVAVAYLRDVLAGIVRSGPRRVLILNAHDANMSTARAAMEWLSGQTAVSLLLANWFQLVPWPDAARFLGPEQSRGHGGSFETSGVLAFAPDAVDLTAAADLPPRPRLDAADHVLVESHPAPWAGWSGYPSKVTAEAAAGIRALAAERLRALVAAWLAGPPPQPPGGPLHRTTENEEPRP